MKTILILVIASLLSGKILAQNAYANQNYLFAYVIDAQKGDSVIMKEGSVWLIKEGKRIIVATEVELGGTKVKFDGTVILKDGTNTTLQEGDVVLSNGKLIRATSKVQLERRKEKNLLYGHK